MPTSQASVVINGSSASRTEQKTSSTGPPSQVDKFVAAEAELAQRLWENPQASDRAQAYHARAQVARCNADKPVGNS
ncbi:hypothetical protein C8035_v006406 [Colletotrichum spinosum]|uniref:Uncharacterized protein n=1 Tax=Colletotrichum spinosum TaxID=1347390 RepID=A0A4R8QMW2_9PEZI|nr:hypothetical protein C8035_v006406 [Colletotrichum spinosum]